MGDKRKLLAEVDRTLKKVDEGVELFDEIWEKVQDAATQALKDKYEQDLKKEIKKLQKLRDQIKSWISSCNEIRDKDGLIAKRKLIETKMEAFKEVEREAKTKNYSKEGLANASRLDPKQKEKVECRDALTTWTEEITLMQEQLEAEAEEIQINSRKKKGNSVKSERLNKLQTVITSNLVHVAKIECMIRMLDNDCLEPAQINEITDDINYYIDQAKLGEPHEAEYVYDVIDMEAFVDVKETPLLDQLEQSKEHAEDKSHANSKNEATTTITVTNKRDNDKYSQKHRALSPVSSESNAMSPSPALSSSDAAIIAKSRRKSGPDEAKLSKGGNKNAKNVIPTPIQGYAAIAAAHVPASPKVSLTASPLAKVEATPSTVAFNGENSAKNDGAPRKATMEASVESIVENANSSNIGLEVKDRKALQASVSNVDVDKSSKSVHVNKLIDQETKQKNTQAAVLSALEALSLRDPPSSMPHKRSTIPTSSSIMQSSAKSPVSDTQAAVAAAAAVVSSLTTTPLLPMNLPPPASEHEAKARAASISPLILQSAASCAKGANGSGGQNSEPQSAFISPFHAINPLGSWNQSKDLLVQHSFLESSMNSLPMNTDCDRLRPLPRIPTPVANCYPRQVPLILNAQEWYDNVDNSTLFWLFYMTPGTLAQSMAASALKKKSWRYHTKLRTWFQRLEDPKRITKDNEQGNFRYFCVDTWKEQVRQDFTFEYMFLEDYPHTFQGTPYEKHEWQAKNRVPLALDELIAPAVAEEGTTGSDESTAAATAAANSKLNNSGSPQNNRPQTHRDENSLFQQQMLVN